MDCTDQLTALGVLRLPEWGSGSQWREINQNNVCTKDREWGSNGWTYTRYKAHTGKSIRTVLENTLAQERYLRYQGRVGQ